MDANTMNMALAGCFALALGAAPIGVFLVMRRTALIGDALSHAVLPGVAIAYVFAGFSLGWMMLGGLIAGLMVALLATVVSRLTPLAEDASLAAFFIISLALGTLLVATFGTDEELLHILFGHLEDITPDALITMACVSTFTMMLLAVIYRPLVCECFDPSFLRSAGLSGAIVHGVFLSLVVLNLVSGFQALGTLMCIGLMILTAISARFWAESVGGQICVAVALTLLSGFAGVMAAKLLHTPPEASIVLSAGVFYIASLLAGPKDSIGARLLRLRHLDA
jgi:zinc/manganese transport system permease protein